jgi:hypothetical protein
MDLKDMGLCVVCEETVLQVLQVCAHALNAVIVCRTVVLPQMTTMINNMSLFFIFQ